MEVWKEYKLKDILTFAHGKAIAAKENGAFKVYGSNGLIGFSDNYKYENGIVIGRVGAYCGSITFETDKFWASDNAIVAYAKVGHDVKFISYLLQSFPLNDFAGGSAQPLLNQGVLARISSSLPSLPTQQRIASILSAYDELIEVNNQRIKLLEETASQLYKEWFVRMRFPGYKKAKFEKGIPEGWEVKKLKDISFINKKSINSKSKITELNYIDISSVTTGRVEFITKYLLKDAPGRAKRIVVDGDIIFSTVRPENKAYSFIIHPKEYTIALTGFCVISSKERIFSEYIYFIVASESFIDEMSVKAKGSAYPQVGFDDIANYEMLLPVEGLIKQFHEIADPIFNQINVLQQQNTHLRQIRDRLLPRLISGKLKLSESGFTGFEDEQDREDVFQTANPENLKIL